MQSTPGKRRWLKRTALILLVAFVLDWHEVTDEYGLPGFLDSISTNPARDEHFVRVVLDLVKRGERVFAVAGSSHAVKLEPALRGAK